MNTENKSQAQVGTVVLDSPGLKIEWIGDIKKYTLYDSKEATMQKLTDEHIAHYQKVLDEGGKTAKIMVVVTGSLLNPRNIASGTHASRYLERMAIEKPLTVEALSVVVIKNKIVETIIKNIARSVYGNSGFFKHVHFVTSEELALLKLQHLDI